MPSHHTYKKIEVVGSSPTSIEDAIDNALAECAKTLHNMDWFEVTETRGHIENGKVGHYRVTLKVNDRALLWNSLSKSSATSIKKSRAVDARLESFKQGGVKQREKPLCQIQKTG